jgi:hypothetical protein
VEEWILVAQDTDKWWGVLVNTVMNTKLAKKAEHFLTSWETISFSRQKLHGEGNGQAFNPLNAELNSICHLLVLLGDLTFMGPCIVSIFQYTCISNKIQRYTVYLCLETALHVSGGTCTYHQERIQLYLQHLVFFTPLLLSDAIVEELERV